MYKSMDRILMRLAARSHLKNKIGEEKNHVKVSIYRKDKKIKLSFLKKPTSNIRKQVRLIGFTWSRKHYSWKAYLSNERVENVKKLYRSIDNKN